MKSLRGDRLHCKSQGNATVKAWPIDMSLCSLLVCLSLELIHTYSRGGIIRQLFWICAQTLASCLLIIVRIVTLVSAQEPWVVRCEVCHQLVHLNVSKHNLHWKGHMIRLRRRVQLYFLYFWRMAMVD